MPRLDEKEPLLDKLERWHYSAPTFWSCIALFLLGFVVLFMGPSWTTFYVGIALTLPLPIWSLPILVLGVLFMPFGLFALLRDIAEWVRECLARRRNPRPPASHEQENRSDGEATQSLGERERLEDLRCEFCRCTPADRSPLGSVLCRGCRENYREFQCKMCGQRVMYSAKYSADCPEFAVGTCSMCHMREKVKALPPADLDAIRTAAECGTFAGIVEVRQRLGWSIRDAYTLLEVLCESV